MVCLIGIHLTAPTRRELIKRTTLNAVAINISLKILHTYVHKHIHMFESRQLLDEIEREIFKIVGIKEREM